MASLLGIGAGLVCILGAATAGIRLIVAKRRQKPPLLLLPPPSQPSNKVDENIFFTRREYNAKVCKRSTLHFTPKQRAEFREAIKNMCYTRLKPDLSEFGSFTLRLEQLRQEDNLTDQLGPVSSD